MILDQVFYLIDIDETPLRALPLKVEYKLEDLQDSTNRLEVRIPLQDSGRIVTDQQLVFRGRRFSILGLGFDKDTSEIIITADELQARLVDVNNPTYNLKNETLPQAMAKAAAKAAGWTVGDVFETVLNYNAELKNVSTLFALRFLERQSGGRLFFDSGKKIIHMRRGNETIADVVFRYGKNVANITKEQTSPQATVLFPYGRDGMTIEAVTGGKKYVEDFSWYIGLGMTLADARKKYTKELVWTDDRYIYNSNLYRDAVTRLAVLSQPQINYTLTNAQAEGVELGQLAYVHDEDLDIRVLVAVSKLIRSSNPEENEIELNYIPPSLGATLDNEYSGDTNTGTNGEISLFQAKNQAVVAVSGTANTAITADVTVYSATSFEIGVVLQLQVTTAGILSGYFTIDGERLPTDIKQTVPLGWHTFGLPFVVTGIQEGTKTLRFFVQFEGSGAGSIAKEKAELFIKASGVYGGASNDKPDQTILEEVEIPESTFSVAENVIEFRDIPRLFAPSEAVIIEDPGIIVSDRHSLTFERLVSRLEFAKMADYPTYEDKPAQAQVDQFIDVTRAADKVFKVITLGGGFVYVFSTTGTFININTTARTITSDGQMHSSDSSEAARPMGTLVDWTNQAGEIVSREFYKRV